MHSIAFMFHIYAVYMFLGFLVPAKNHSINDKRLDSAMVGAKGPRHNSSKDKQTMSSNLHTQSLCLLLFPTPVLTIDL